MSASEAAAPLYTLCGCDLDLRPLKVNLDT